MEETAANDTLHNDTFLVNGSLDPACELRVEGDFSLLTFIVYGILVNVISLIGFIGNVISISILSKPNMRSSINCCLVGLATFDAILLVTSFLMFGLPAIPEYTGTFMWYQRDYFPWVILGAYPLGLIAQTGSVYLTVTVTMERYVAVCHPLKARSICTFGRAKQYVLAAAFFSLLYNIPRFLEVTYAYCSLGGIEFTTVTMTNIRRDPNYIMIYITWMYLVVMYLVPFLSLLIFNIFIFIQIRRVKKFVITSGRGDNEEGEVRLANHERQRLSRLQKKELGLAVMLLFVVVVFFVCNILPFIVAILEVLEIKIGPLTMFSNLLVTINSSVNFIIYCIFGQKFRRLFLQLFCFGMGGGFGQEDSIMAGNSVYGERQNLNGRNTCTRSIRLSSWSDSHHNRITQPHNNGTWHSGRGGMSILSSNQYSNLLTANKEVKTISKMSEQEDIELCPLSASKSSLEGEKIEHLDKL